MGSWDVKGWVYLLEDKGRILILEKQNWVFNIYHGVNNMFISWVFIPVVDVVSNCLISFNVNALTFFLRFCRFIIITMLIDEI